MASNRNLTTTTLQNLINSFLQNRQGENNNFFHNIEEQFTQSIPTNQPSTPLPPQPPPLPPTYHNDLEYKDLNDIMYMYNKTITEYNNTFQTIIELNLNSNSRLNTNDLRNMIHYLNLNIQSYHNITKQGIELLQTLYLSNPVRNHVQTPTRSHVSPPPYPPPVQTPIRSHVQPPPPPPPPIQTNSSTRSSSRVPYIQRDLNGRTIRPVRQNLGTYYLNTILTQPTVNENTNHGLTANQIQQYTETFTWEDSSANSPPQVCPISLEIIRAGDQVMRIRSCNHIFNAENLTRWFRNSHYCPICRRDVTAPPIVQQRPQTTNNSENIQEDEPSDNEHDQEDEENEEEHEDEEVETNNTVSSNLFSLFSDSSMNSLLDRFLTNELTQIINDDLSSVINSTGSNSTVPYGTIEIFRDIIPIDIEYRIQMDSSRNSI